MCKAFSGLVKENGEVVWQWTMDSHEELIKLAKLDDSTDRKDQMAFARFEIAPANGNYLTPDKWRFRLDEQATPAWWSKAHEQFAWNAHHDWKKKLDKVLVHKQIIHPFRDILPPKKITKKHLALLKRWASVVDSVGASVVDSVRVSVWDSVVDSVVVSVVASVGASVGAYAGSFFHLPRKAWKYTEKIKSKGYPLQPAVDLWELGLVPSYDGATWRLHGGKDGKVIWEGKI